MNNLKTEQRVLLVLSIILFVIAIIAYIKVRCNDATGWGALASAGWLLISVGAIILAFAILLIKLFIYIVVYFMDKSMKQLKKVAFIAMLVFIASLLLFNLFDILFYSFIISLGILVYIGLVSVTVLIVRRVKRIVV